MKKLWVLSALAALTLVACDKDDDDDTEKPKTNNELIVGTWTSVAIEELTMNNDNGDTAYYFSLPGPFLTLNFDGNGSVTTTGFGDTAVGTYTISGNNLFMVSEGDTIDSEITTLSETSLIFESEATYMDNSVSFTDKSKMEFSK